MDETQGDEGVSPGGTRVQGQLQSSPNDSDNGCSTTFGAARASSQDYTPDRTQVSGFDAILHEIQELQENKGRLEERFENLKSHHQQQYVMIMEVLQEEQFRGERLEEQLNDLIELHQNEILNLKEELAGMEEKSAYQSYERATDIHEALEVCQIRLFKLEQQQQVVQPEGLENTVQTLLGKLISALLAVMAVIVAFVSTLANCVIPMMRTCSCMLFTLLIVVLFLWRHWAAVLEYPKHLFCSHHPENGDE